MADKVLFEVDASQILAKLHLAGLQQFSYDKNKLFIINTGIKNDDPGAKPDNPGKVTFDLTNSSGEYEVGYVTDVTYTKSYTKSYGLSNKLNDLNKIIAQITNGKVDGKIDSKVEKEKEELIANIKQTLKLTDNDVKNITTVDDVKTLENLAKDKMKQTNDFNKAINDLSNDAIKILQSYMKVFAGADNAKDIGENFSYILISPNAKSSNDSSLVKMFEIVPISDAEQAKLEAQFRATAEKKPENNCKQPVCFKIKYELNIDK